MNSSIVHFIDLMKINHNKLYYHRHLMLPSDREPEYAQFTMQLNWNII